MWAVVVAASLMMWMWSAAGLHGSAWLERSGNHPVRMAYLAVIVALGAVVILLPFWFVLPNSSLTQGWPLKQLQYAQQFSVAAVLLLGIASVWRAHLLLRVGMKPTAGGVAPVKAGQKKRRP
jgi:hypothetical protein